MNFNRWPVPYHSGLLASFSALLTALCFTLPAVSAEIVTAETHAPVSQISLPAIEQSLDDTYDQARNALRKGQISKYKKLRKKLSSHPLAIYLDYYYLSDRLRSVKASEVKAFLDRAEGSPLAPRIKKRYLSYIGPKRRWRDYLLISPNEPRATDLRCYYHRAQLQQGSKEIGYRGAESLWLSGSSQPKACDVLFDEWHKAGLRTNEQIWKRMLLTFDAKERGLLSYLSRKLTGQSKKYGNQLWAVYNKPKALSNAKLFSQDNLETRAIVSAGLRKLARTSPKTALKYWQQYQHQLSFSVADSASITRQIIRYAYIRKDKAATKWGDEQLAQLANDDLTERRLRQLLKQQDWPQIEQVIYALTPKRQQSERWQYWLAHIEQQKGLADAAQKRLQQIASGRNYYSYLAAQSLNQPYQLAAQATKPAPVDEQQLAKSTGLGRVAALMSKGQASDANSEWIYLLRRSSSQERLALSHFALDQGWWHLAISSAIQAQAWDAVDLRFPIAHTELFDTFSQMRHVDETLLMAVARRESSYNRFARSPKDARGLMQLMPGTAKDMARRINLRYRGVSSLYQPETNIRLGSAYLKRLLKQFNQNRILAIASYNAGPSRIDNWLKDDVPLPFDVWVETIPFRETRDYVQAVLAYQVIYAIQTGRHDFEMLSEREMKGVY